MIFIDDAGTGCYIGNPLLIAYRAETGEKAVGYLYPGSSVVDVGWAILYREVVVRE